MARVRRVPEPTVERIKDQERAKDRARKRGLRLPERPEGEVPVLTAPDGDLGEWSDGVLMTQFTLFTRWADHLNVEVALAEITEATAERIFRRIRDVAMLGVSPARGQVTAAKAAAGLSAEVIEAEDEAASAKAYRKLVQSLYENVERDASLLSRELTRRLGRDPYERRERRWTP